MVTSAEWLQAARQFPQAPCERAMKMEIMEVDLDAASIVLRFQPPADFVNHVGGVQGGMIAGMLDTALNWCMGPAVERAQLEPSYVTTLSLTTNFVAKTQPEPMLATARCSHLGKSTGYFEAKLTRERDGVLIASATAVCKPIPFSGLKSVQGTAAEIPLTPP